MARFSARMKSLFVVEIVREKKNGEKMDIKYTYIIHL